MEKTQTPSSETSGARTRATFLVAILTAFCAGLLIGYILGSGAEADETPIPETVYAVEVGASPQLGPLHAPVTIAVFSNFRCGHCRKAASRLEQLQARFDTDLRVVFKHFVGKHSPDVLLAHEASAGAHAQGKFWAFHDRMFGHRGPVTREVLESAASEVGLDLGRFRDDLDRHAHRASVERDVEQGRSLGITGTPTFFINGRKVVGTNWKLIERIIRHEKERTAELIESGVPAERIYTTILKEGLKPPKEPPAPPPTKPAPRIEDPDAIYAVKLGNSTVLGQPEAHVTLVLFLDYQCPFSEKASQTTKQLMETHGDAIRVVIKNNPQPRHPGASLAAEAALAAGSQGSFRKMYEKLFANRNAQSRQDLEAYAKELGLEMKAFREALDNHTFLPTVKQEQALAAKIGATSTPTYFINGRKLKGNQPIEAIEKAIEKAKAEAEKLLASGVDAANLYDHVIKNGATSIQYKEPAAQASTPPGTDPNIPL